MAFYTIHIKTCATASQWREMEQAYNSGEFEWAETSRHSYFDPMRNHFYYEEKYLPTLNDTKHLLGLSKLYPSLLFCYEKRGGSREYFCNGEVNGWPKLVGLWTKHLKDELRKTMSKQKKIAEGTHHRIEIMPGGKLAAYGENRFGECDVLSWTEIQQISCGNWHTVGLKKDGTIVSCGSNINGQCDTEDVSEKVMEISCGRYHTALLLESGKVAVKGHLEPRPILKSIPWTKLDLKTTVKNADLSPVSTWPPIKKIKSIFDAVIGITEDGKIYMDGYCPLSKQEIKKIMI